MRIVALWLGLCFLGACTDPRFVAHGADAETSDDAGKDGTDGGQRAPDAALASDANVSADGRDEDAAASDATLEDADTPPDATIDAGGAQDADSAPDALSPDAAGTLVDAAAPTERTLTIAADEDDAVWRAAQGGGWQELLHFVPEVDNSSGFTIEVSTDDEECHAGLRFRLPFGPGTNIVSAKLTLTRIGRNSANPTDTMRVRIFDADTVGPFDPTHVHVGAAHAIGGLWGEAVGGFAVGNGDEAITSPELKTLVQHVVDRPGFARDAYVGFVLSPERMDNYTLAEFADSSQGPAPKLTLSYVEGR